LIVDEFKKFSIQPKQLHTYISTKTETETLPSLAQVQGLINRKRQESDSMNHISGVEVFVY
jgi:hypothetical protein